MKRDLVTKALFISLIRALGAVLAIVLTAIIARQLGPDGLGLYAYGTTIITILSVPVSYGIATLLLRLTTHGCQSGDFAQAKGLYRRAAIYALCVSSGALFVYVAFRLVSPTFLPQSVTPILAVLITSILFFDQQSAMRNAALRAFDRQIVAQFPEMLLRPTLMILFFAASSVLLAPAVQITISHTFAALLLSAAASAFFGQLILTRSAPIAFRNAVPSYDDRGWLKTSMTLGSSAGLVILIAYVDIFVLGFFVPLEEIGHYRVALLFASLTGFGYVSLNMVAAQRFAHFSARKDPASIQRAARLFTLLAVLTAIPGPLILLVMGKPLIVFIFGESFAVALPATLVLCSLQFVSAATGMAHSLLIMSGFEARVLRLSLASLIVNLILLLILVPQFGIIGAASANFIASSGWNIALCLFARQTTGVDTSIFNIFLTKVA